MILNDVIWLEDIVEKIQDKHGVEPWEVEEVLLGDPKVLRGPKGHRKGENLYYALGQTRAGRYLFIVLIRKPGGGALVLSARQMTDRERHKYRRQK